MSKLTDSRVKLLHELIGGIHILKIFNWENFFAKAVQDIRRYAHFLPPNNYKMFVNSPVTIRSTEVSISIRDHVINSLIGLMLSRLRFIHCSHGNSV